MKNKKILILGATGFVGTWLSRALIYADSRLNLNLEITFIGKRNTTEVLQMFSNHHTNISAIQLDFFVSSDGPKINSDILFHLITPSSKSTGFNDNFYLEKVSINSLHFLMNQSSSSSKCPLYIYFSSGGVYDSKNLPKHPFVESSALIEERQASTYQKVKLYSEKKLGEFLAQNDSKVFIPRLFTFYGPGLKLNEHFAIGDFVYNALINKRIVLDAPDTIRSYMHIADLIRAIIISTAKPSNATLNVGSKNPISMIELASKIQNLIPNTKITENENRSLASYYVPDPNKFNTTFAYEEIINFDLGLSDWLRQLTVHT